MLIDETKKKERDTRIRQKDVKRCTEEKEKMLRKEGYQTRTIALETESGGRIVDNYNTEKALEDYFKKLLNGEEDSKEKKHTQDHMQETNEDKKEMHPPDLEQSIRDGMTVLAASKAFQVSCATLEKLPKILEKLVLRPFREKRLGRNSCKQEEILSSTREEFEEIQSYFKTQHAEIEKQEKTTTYSGEYQDSIMKEVNEITHHNANETNSRKREKMTSETLPVEKSLTKVLEEIPM
ncbi:hypothetical protein ILUMI_12671 [Ignelater luminosus]|uniref:Uncharacterized protein n=1 Tax=Ignelater luminosus TaxID=2038154 RepID=A0A8K0GCQ4_IGNLU|nr:hypothetical protein ILUMI_12671 [Ignelater luminosus]